MSRIRLLLSESWSSIRQNLSTTVAATMTVLIGMCLLGLFIALGTWVLSWSNHIQKELQVHVYFCSTVLPGCKQGATPAQEQAVGARLRHDPRVKQVVFVSKAEAQKKMEEERVQTSVPGRVSNPLPDSWTVTPVRASDTPARQADLRPLFRRRAVPVAERTIGNTGGVTGAARSRSACSRSRRSSRSSS